MRVTEIFDMSEAVHDDVDIPSSPAMPHGRPGILRNSYHEDQGHQEYFERQLEPYTSEQLW